MPIKPVDFQVMVPKTSEVSKIYSDEHQKNQALHQQQASNMQQKAEKDTKQVHSQGKAQEAKIREKQEKNKGKKKEDKPDDNKKDLDKENKGKNNHDKTSTIDIRL